MAKKQEEKVVEVPVLRVVRMMPSPKHVRASDGKNHDLVVAVRDARLFTVGMELREVECPDPTGAPRVWRLVGKLPRRRGIW